MWEWVRPVATRVAVLLLDYGAMRCVIAAARHFAALMVLRLRPETGQIDPIHEDEVLLSRPDLPPDIVQTILAPLDLCAAASVCQAWSAAWVATDEARRRRRCIHSPRNLTGWWSKILNESELGLLVGLDGKPWIESLSVDGKFLYVFVTGLGSADRLIILDEEFQPVQMLAIPKPNLHADANAKDIEDKQIYHFHDGFEHLPRPHS